MLVDYDGGWSHPIMQPTPPPKKNVYSCSRSADNLFVPLHITCTHTVSVWYVCSWQSVTITKLHFRENWTDSTVAAIDGSASWYIISTVLLFLLSELVFSNRHRSVRVLRLDPHISLVTRICTVSNSCSICSERYNLLNLGCEFSCRVGGRETPFFNHLCLTSRPSQCLRQIDSPYIGLGQFHYFHFGFGLVTTVSVRFRFLCRNQVLHALPYRLYFMCAWTPYGCR